MTVPATDRRAGPFAGNGVATSFPFTFKVFAAADVAVTFTATDGVETTLALDSDYSVTLNPDQDATPGGAVTYPISGDELAAGESLTVVGNLPYDQTLDLPGGGAFSPRSLENALDRMTMQIQQLAENADRTLQLPVSVDGVDITLPAPSADKIIGWNSAATGLVNRGITDLASVIAYGTNTTELFDGDGITTAFALAADPGSINNLDVSISGVVQSAVKDFTLSGTTLTFTSAPPTGTQNIAVRYGQALPVGVVDWADVRSKAVVYASDFGGNTADDTLEMEGALAAAVGKTLVIPAGWTFTCGPLTIASAMTLRVDGTLKMRDATGVLLTVTAASGFELTGTGDIDLNDTQYIGVKISGSAAPQISGSLTIHNMTGGAASIGNAGALELINCTRPKVRGLRITDILHGTAATDSQPRAITVDTCTYADIEATCDSVNSGVVAAGCTGPRLRVDVNGGGVANDNAFYIITCSDTIIRADIRDWNGEPIVDSGSTNTLVLGGSQIDCIGNSNGFENCTGLTFLGTLFRGSNNAGVLKSRTGNTSSASVRLLDCFIEVSSTQEIVSFVNGAVVDFTMTGTRWIVKHDTGKAFGNRFLRLANTDRFVIEDNTIIFDEVGAAAAADFTIDLDCSEYSSFKRNRLVNRTASGRFRVNGITANVAVEDLYRQSNIDAARDAAYLLAGAEPSEFFGTAAPTAGTFKAGDRVRNTSRTSGGTPGWECIVAGSPGLWKPLRGVATLRDFGAAGGGVVDDTTAVALALASSEAVIDGEGLTYLVSAELAGRSNLTLQNATFTAPALGSSKAVLRFTGTDGTPQTLASNYAEGVFGMTVPNGAAFVVGGWAFLASDEDWSTSDGVTYGELVQIAAIAGNDLTFAQSTLLAYTTAQSARIVPISMMSNITLQNVRVIPPVSTGNQYGIYFDHCANVLVDNCHSENADHSHFVFSRSARCTVNGGSASKTGVQEGLDYGVMVTSGCYDVLVHGGFRVDALRHLITIGGSEGVSRHIRAINNIGHNLTDAGMDSHSAVHEHTFSGNTLHFSDDVDTTIDGMLISGTAPIITGNHIYNCKRNGIFWQPEHLTTFGGTVSAIFSNNRIDAPRDTTTAAAIAVQPVAVANLRYVDAVTIADNHIRGFFRGARVISNGAEIRSVRIAGFQCLRGLRASAVSIEAANGDIDGVDIDGGELVLADAATAAVVQLVGTSPSFVKNWRIRGAHIKRGSGGTGGVTLTRTTTGFASGNVWDNITTRYTIDGASTVYVLDNHYQGAGTPEGVVTAVVGSTYRRTDGGASTTLYIKESGTGNTGWVAK